jgi:hypothetical protein
MTKKQTIDDLLSLPTTNPDLIVAKLICAVSKEIAPLHKDAARMLSLVAASVVGKWETILFAACISIAQLRIDELNHKETIQ